MDLIFINSAYNTSMSWSAATREAKVSKNKYAKFQKHKKLFLQISTKSLCHIKVAMHKRLFTVLREWK